MTVWLLTFLVHSTLWLCLAWLWTRFRPRMQARVRETVWYTAIAACFITPTAQTFASPESAFWRVPLPSSLVSTREAEHRETETLGAAWSRHAARESAEHHRSLAHDRATTPAILSAREARAGWEGIVLGAWLVLAGILVLRYLGRREALRRRLGPREIVRDPRARGVLTRLGRRAGLRPTPRLTESENLGSPIALGFGLRAEICVPTRALHELDQDQFSALLGHEVAHLRRRDPLRMSALNTLLAVFFVQPLLRLAVRGIHLAAEERCDDWAANRVDDRLAMASCLTEVAAWVLPRDRRLEVPCMARRRSRLWIRVDRLLNERRRPEAPRRIRLGLGCAALLALAIWLAPAVAPANEPAHEEQVTSGEIHEHEARPRRMRGGHHDRLETRTDDDNHASVRHH